MDGVSQVFVFIALFSTWLQHYVTVAFKLETPERQYFPVEIKYFTTRCDCSFLTTKLLRDSTF